MLIKHIFLTENVGTNPGLAALWDDEKQRRRDNGECSQVESDISQGIGGPYTSSSLPSLAFH